MINPEIEKGQEFILVEDGSSIGCDGRMMRLKFGRRVVAHKDYRAVELVRLKHKDSKGLKAYALNKKINLPLLKACYAYLSREVENVQ